MPDTALFKLDGYESPKKLIQNFRDLVCREGSKVVMKQGRFKIDREKGVAGITCIGMTKLTGKFWFVKTADPEEQTPDFRAAAFDQIENGKYLIWKEVECEIVECPKKLIPDGCVDPEKVFFDHIKRTKLSKEYPSNFVLIIYSRFAWKGFRLDKLSKLFCDYNPKLMGIWDLMNISPQGDTHLLAKLFPDREDITINISDILVKNAQMLRAL